MRDNIARLINWQACQPSIDFVQSFDSIEQAWQRCNRGDWMLWLAARGLIAEPWSADRKALICCALECFSLVKESATERSNQAVDLLNQWLDGEVIIDVDSVRRESQTAVAHAYGFAPSLTIAACIYVDAICLAASDQFVNAIAGALAGACFEMAGALPIPPTVKIVTSVRDMMLKQTADIVREHYPNSPL